MTVCVFNVFSSVNILVAVVRAVVGSVLGHRTQGGVEEKGPLTKHRDITSVEMVVRTMYLHTYIVYVHVLHVQLSCLGSLVGWSKTLQIMYELPAEVHSTMSCT